MLSNRAINARDAMAAGGELIIETYIGDVGNDDERAILHLTGGYAILSVSDTGTGMTAEIQARMCEPFFTTKEDGKGSGLGLATVYGSGEQCGGVIRVRSAPGRGTKCRIYLPLVTEVTTTPGHCASNERNRRYRNVVARGKGCTCAFGNAASARGLWLQRC